MWKVGESECDGYLTQQRKSISFTAWVKKGSYFSKGRGYRSTAKRSNTQSVTAAWRFRQMPVFQAQMKCGFMSGMKDTAAGLCDLKKEEITGVFLVRWRESTARVLTRREVSKWNCHHFLPLFNSQHGHPFLFCSSGWLRAVCPVELKHPLCLKIHVAICFHLAAHLSTRTAEMNAYWAQRVDGPPETQRLWDLAYGALFRVYWTVNYERLPCVLFPNFEWNLASKLVTPQDSSRTDRTRVFRIFKERTQDTAVFVVNTTPQKYQENTTSDISQRIKSWKSPYV